MIKEKVKEETKEDILKAKEITEYTSILFENVEILSLLGEGSFGKVFKIRLNDNIYAMKSMNKTKLIQNKNIKYAISEAEIMSELNHPYVLRLEYAF